MMNYPYPPSSPYIHAAMSHALQVMMSGAPLPPNCLIMAMPIPSGQPMLPQLMINSPYYAPSPYTKNTRHQPTPPKANYPIVSYKKLKRKVPVQPHPNIYNSSSFDSYMHHLSWSRLFDRPSRKTVKPPIPSEALKTPRLNSSSSSSSTTSDETIRRVDVTNKPPNNPDSKQPINGTLPFKYSSEYIPGIGKQSQKLKSNDVFFIKKHWFSLLYKMIV